MMVRVLLPIWFISWIVLMPVTSVNNSSPNMTGLDRFNYGYVAPANSPRYAAHVVLAYLFTCEFFFSCGTFKSDNV